LQDGYRLHLQAGIRDLKHKNCCEKRGNQNAANERQQVRAIPPDQPSRLFDLVHSNLHPVHSPTSPSHTIIVVFVAKPIKEAL
jgi:hypothetical protein